MTSTTRLRLVAALLAIAAGLGTHPTVSAEDDGKTEIAIAEIGDRKEPVDFAREILPILRANCLACHSSTKARGDLILETPQTILTGGEEGPGIVPGKGAESFLLHAASRKSKPFMPPPKNKVGARALTPQELGLIKLWIDQGGKGSAPGVNRQIKWHPLPAGHNPIYATAVSPNGTFAACGRANQIFVYDLTTTERHTTRLSDPALVESGPYKRPGLAHLDHVQSLAFHPDSDVLVSGGFRCVKIWRRGHAVELGAVEGEVRLSNLSPDGSLLATVDAKGSLSVWEVDARKRRAQFDTKHGEVQGIVFTGDSTSICSVGTDGTLRVWSATDGKQLGGAKLSKPASRLVVCGESKLVVTADGDKGLHVWPLPTEVKEDAAAEPVREFGGHAKKITTLAAVSATDSRVVSGSEEGKVIFWNAADGKEVRSLTHGAPLVAVAARSDGKRLATLGADKKLRLWNAEDGKVVADPAGDFRVAQRVARQERHVKLLGNRRDDLKKDVENRTKDRDKKKEAIKKAQGEVEKQKKALDEKKKALADLQKAEKKDKGKTDKATKEMQNAESAHANAERVLKEAKSDVEKAETGITDANTAVARAEEGIKAPQTELEELKKSAQASAVVPVAVSFVGAGSGAAGRLVAVTENGRIGTWNSDSGKPISLSDAAQGASSAAFGANVVAIPGAKLRLVDVDASWQLERTVGGFRSDGPFVDRVSSIGFSPDGTLLACGGGEPSRSGEIVVLRVADGSVVWKLPNAHSDTVFSVEFSSEGRFLASAGADKFARVFNAKDGKQIKFYEGHTAHVLGVSWQSDSKTLASCGADNVIKVWNVQSGEAKRTISGFSKQVTAIRFIGDGADTVSCSGDKSVRMHRTGDGNNFRNFGGGSDFLYSVDVTPDGSLVVAGGYASVLHLWNGKDAKSIGTYAVPEPAE